MSFIDPSQTYIQIEDAAEAVGLSVAKMRSHVKKHKKVIRTKEQPPNGPGRPGKLLNRNDLIKTLRRPNDPTDMAIFISGKGDQVRKREARRRPEACIEKVTPTKAREWLDVDVNTKNRQPTRGVVERYTRLWREGRYILGPDAIAFDKNGNLINGQHRLRAIVNTGMTLEFIVARGLNPEAFFYIDMPKMRNFKDPLGIKGFDRSKDLAPMIKWIESTRRVEQGNLSPKYPDRLSPQAFPVEDVVDFAVQHRETLYDSISMVPQTAGKMFNKNMLRAMHWVYSQQDPHLANAFIEALIKGLNYPLGGATDPVYRLRKTFEKILEKGHKVRPHFLLAYTHKAWNLLKRRNKGSGRGSTRGVLTHTETDPWPYIDLFPAERARNEKEKKTKKRKKTSAKKKTKKRKKTSAKRKRAHK